MAHPPKILPLSVESPVAGHASQHISGSSNQTHVSATDLDAKLASKDKGTAAMVGYTMNGLMENWRLSLRDQCGIVPRSRLGDGRRADLDRPVPSSTIAGGFSRSVQIKAITEPFLRPSSTDGSRHTLPQDHRSRAQALTGEAAELEGGLLSLATGARRSKSCE